MFSWTFSSPSQKRDILDATETPSDEKSPKILSVADAFREPDCPRERAILDTAPPTSGIPSSVSLLRNIQEDGSSKGSVHHPTLFTPHTLNAERTSTLSDNETLTDARSTNGSEKGHAGDLVIQKVSAHRHVRRENDADTKLALTPLCVAGRSNGQRDRGDSPEGDRESQRRLLPSELDSPDDGLLGGADDETNATRSGARRKPHRQHDFRRWRCALAVAFLAVVLTTVGAVAVVQRSRAPALRNKVLFSNGTHDFGPTTILVSFDGLRADYLDRGLNPAFDEMAKSGVQARYMTPAFPSTTFPNHYTIATGLYPESHGIVGNYFWDPVLNDTFVYTDPKQSLDSKWWGGEPIWVTAVLQGLRSAVCMWPGASSVIRGRRPTLEIPFDGNATREMKVRHVMDWLNLPFEKRPNFISVYFPEVDVMGHEYGPDSKEVNDALVGSDSALRSLMEGLKARNLTNVANLVVLSDHGMTQTSNTKLIYLEDWMDVDLLWRLDGYPIGGIWLHRSEDVDAVYRNLSRPTPDGIVDPKGKYAKPFSVYLRETVPVRFHFSNNARIAPIVVVPNVSYNIVKTRAEHPPDVPYKPIGMHGYDNLDVEMRAMFSAKGPDFLRDATTTTAAAAGAQLMSLDIVPGVRRRQGQRRSVSVNGADKDRIPPFSNTEIYALLCRVLRLRPAPNNSTFDGRLPGVRRTK